MSEKTPVIPNQWVQAPASDEIDLRELVLELWRQKFLILSVTLLFAIAGIGYAMTARQVWTSQALISEPSIEQVNVFQLRIDQLKNSLPVESSVAMDFSTLQRAELYRSFVAAFNSMNNKRTFLTEQGIFSEELSKAGVTDRRSERALMSKLGEVIVAKPFDKTGTDMTLSFSAETAELAQQRLVKYIEFVQNKQVADKNAELRSLWKNRIKALTSQYENIKSDTLQTRQDDIRRTQYSLRISQAAGVEKPLERMNSKDIFNIDLGSKGLAEKLKILEEIKDPEVLNEGLGKVRLQLSGLKALQLTNAPFDSFKMIDSPEEPFTRDKPKRPLIVVLATLLGGMLGIAIVLVRHAFRRSEAA
ncbi:LPS O-antigen chain length determinant protein WzzB [Aeromonas finlandensis]|uniref:LPS O-antigen chain length determinant protein WzzB n=1 Tax=Aeromonas finlandensis TaxID=1543375 RepID=UPI00051C1303|nr:Wzz/FepE/Etk N-terminal domain-containing protein [Aeromonas finlandensis]